jgi:LuxR family maltose regulon positive regulatory protein
MLLTKIHIPATARNLVQRVSLFDKLNEGLHCKLILVSAPAGFGKTTVICDWVQHYGIPAAWYSIDSNDNDSVDFLSYIIASIQKLKSNFGSGTLNLLNSPNQPAPESIIKLLVNEILDIDKNFILVLDDFHLITNNEILKALKYLIEYLPQNMHVVLLSRSDPNLPIAKLRSQNQLVELRLTDLSFSANDIAVLFNKKLNAKLSINDIQALEIKTEGWIAGLQLAALSMKGQEHPSDFIQALAGNNRYIMDYLIEEVLKIQSDDVKDFLLKTSVLDQFSAPLCDAVLNRTDSHQIIEKLENNNMFLVALDTDRNWYRYHHLFSDLLKQRLLLTYKSNVNTLHNNACQWFEQNNMLEPAFVHALKIQNYEKGIKLLNKVVENMWENGHHTAITKYATLLPDEWIKKDAKFCLYHAWILVAAGQMQKAEPYLSIALQTTQEITENKNSSQTEKTLNKKLLGKIAVAYAYMHSHEAHSDKIFDYCSIAMTHLTDDDPLWFSWAWFSYGIAHFSKGELHESNKAFNRAFEYGIKSGNIYLISTIAIRMAENEQQLGNYTSAFKKCADLLNLIKQKGYSPITEGDWTYAALYFIMGISQFMWVETEKAFENIKIAYRLCKDGNDMYLKIFVLMVYSIVLKELGDSEYETKTHELDELIKQNEIPPFLTSIYVGWKTYLLIESNKMDEAHNFIIKYIPPSGTLKTTLNEAIYTSYSRLLLLQGNLNEAEQLLTELYAAACEGARIERMTELNILFALLYKCQGNKKKACEKVFEAMELTYKENLLSYFVFNNDDIADILADAIKAHATSQTNVPTTYIENLRIALEKRSKKKKGNLEIDLSTRERDTLKLIAEELSNRQIADKLFISLNTVKTHLKNINIKLETDSRASAVVKAKNLGLI